MLYVFLNSVASMRFSSPSVSIKKTSLILILFFYKDGDKSMCNRHPMQLSLNHYWRSVSSVPFQFTHSHKLRLGYERHVGVGILSPITRLLW